MNDLQFMPHQDEVLNLTDDKNRCAYYLDMGLGKTFVGAEKMYLLNNTVNLIVCQKSKIDDWVDHMKTYYPEYRVMDLTKKKMSDQKKLSAREYLKQLEVLDMQINDDIATLSDMKMNVCSAGGIDYSRDKVQTSPVGDKLCKDVVRYTMFSPVEETLSPADFRFSPAVAIFCTAVAD